MEATMQLDMLRTATPLKATSPMAPSTREADSLIASDRVEGTPVRRSDGTKIGTIDRLMIDRHSGHVAYAVMNFGGFLGLGQQHLPIPWARLTYDRTLCGYQLDMSDEDFGRAPVSRERAGGKRDLNDRSHLTGISMLDQSDIDLFATAALLAEPLLEPGRGGR
jgi:hypothetical protein